MKKLLGYSIAGILSLAFIIVVGLALYLTLIKPIWHITSYLKEPATIVSCASKSFSRGGNRYTPVSQAQDGVQIIGNVFWASRSACESQIGEHVSVLVNPKNRTEGDILSLSQFWFFPLLFISLLTLIIIGGRFNKHRQKI